MLNPLAFNRSLCRRQYVSRWARAAGLLSPIVGYVGFAIASSFKIAMAGVCRQFRRATTCGWQDTYVSPAAREYDSFGQIIPNSAVSTWPGRFGYQGQAWMEIFSADASQRVLLSPTRIYDPIIGRFLQNEPNQFLRPIAHYLYCRNRPTRKVDPTGLWDENGHFYTTYIVARAAGLSNEQAKALAYFSQLPDEDTDFDATHAGLARAGGIEGEEFYKKNAWRKDVQEVLHSLHGGDSKKRRDCLKKLLLTGNLKDWQKGLVIHAFGDAYAHTTLDDGKLVSAAAKERATSGGYRRGHSLIFFLSEIPQLDILPRSFAAKERDREYHRRVA